uniref:Uncharacterized protein n=1 Tax=Marseillevirus LCMAC101 TaxID=2506602 RepID=A0A481YSZ4_9VIRU|nr:MAG: hypothetical protein LCMAC101_02090 [Marseillevirus LCMAC101]
MEIIPPASSGIPPFSSVSVTSISADGNSAGSIGYPNDTVNPKQQTIQYEPLKDYIVNLLDPVLSLP